MNTSRHIASLTLSIAACFGALFSTGAAVAATDVNATTPMVGLGINRLTYWHGTQSMVDVARESTFFSLDWTYEVSADADGAPGQDFRMTITSRLLGAGTYKLSFKGQATTTVNSIAVGGASNLAYLQNLVYDAATNTTTADLVVPVNITNAWLNFTNTQRTPLSLTNDGVTDIHLWRPGYPMDNSRYFTDEFITAMQKVQVIRTMDFTYVNQNPSVDWADRNRITLQGFGGLKGQSWELVVALANETNRDIWINVPVQASDDYILKLAQLLRYGSDGVNPYTGPVANPVFAPLNPGLKVYVEYGNEVWNSGYGFYGFGWAMQLANAVRMDTSHPIAFDGPVTDQYVALRRWVGYRSAFVSNTFRSVFGDSAMMTTVRPVLTSQAGNSYQTLGTALRWADAFYGKIRTTPYNPDVRTVPQLWWGAGGAGYYESSSAPTDTSAATMTAYFAGLPNSNLAIQTASDSIWSRAYGLVSTTYEGGPQPGSNGGAPSSDPTLSATYNNDPRMKDRMLVAQGIYEANGGQFFTHYIYSGGGAWSYIDDLNPKTVSDTTSVKIQALDAINVRTKSNPTLGKLAPGVVTLRTASNAAIATPGAAAAGTFSSTAFRLPASSINEPGLAESVLVPVRSGGAKNFTVAITTYNAPAGSQVELLVNGQSIGVYNLVASTSGTAVTSAYLPASFNNGLNFIRLRSLNGEVWVKDVVVK